MSNSVSLEKYLKDQGITKLYHFTDRSNIQSIIDNGGLYSWWSCEAKSIKINRPGGSSQSRSLDSYKGLGNYVRLSFTRNHPMMYVAQSDGRINNPVILEIDLSIVNLSTTKFSDRNATKNGAIIGTGFDGAQHIHFSVVTQRDHFNLMPYEKEFYQAEVLVLEKVPISYIKNIDDYRPKPIAPKITPNIQRHTSSSYDEIIGRINRMSEAEKMAAIQQFQERIKEIEQREKEKKDQEFKKDAMGCLAGIIFILIIIIGVALAG